MFRGLVSHNDDLLRLIEKGYAIAFDSSYLIVRDIPYLNDVKQLCMGAIVTKLVFIDQERVRQDDHQIFFAGGAPHSLDGMPIPNLGGGTTTLALSEASKDVVVQRSFSNKPLATGSFQDFFEKIESYVRIISGPAIALHKANPLTFRTVETVPSSVFKMHDTLTSRAEITDLSARFASDVIAVIGLGGTGGYLLDFLVKMPVCEIRAFDHDTFYVHNAFRSPGKLAESELGKTKAEVYRSRYENFRSGLTFEPWFIDTSSDEKLEGVTFAFVCVDKGSSRAAIFDVLIAKGIPFIDVGMGLNRKQGPLSGMLRTTYYSAKHGKQVREKGLALLADEQDDVYRVNIQISELNALNASLALIKFKQIRGFYCEEDPCYHLLLTIGDLKLMGKSDLS
jgi:hypothetical protein